MNIKIFNSKQARKVHKDKIDLSNASIGWHRRNTKSERETIKDLSTVSVALIVYKIISWYFRLLYSWERIFKITG